MIAPSTLASQSAARSAPTAPLTAAGLATSLGGASLAGRWFTVKAFASAAGISPRSLRRALGTAIGDRGEFTWHGLRLQARTARNGATGCVFEVAIAASPEKAAAPVQAPVSRPGGANAYDRAEAASAAVLRLTHVLDGIDIVINDKIGTTNGDTPTSAVELVWGLVDVARNLAKEAYDAANEVAFSVSGAAERGSQPG